MSNSKDAALYDAARKFLDSIPGDSWDKGEALVMWHREQARELAAIKAATILNNTDIAEDKKVNRFIAQRARYQDRLN
jgi:hypothetical protein